MSKKCHVCKNEITDEWRRRFSDLCSICGLPRCKRCGRVWIEHREVSKFWDTNEKPEDGELCSECKNRFTIQ